MKLIMENWKKYLKEQLLIHQQAGEGQAYADIVCTGMVKGKDNPAIFYMIFKLGDQLYYGTAPILKAEDFPFAEENALENRKQIQSVDDVPFKINSVCRG